MAKLALCLGGDRSTASSHRRIERLFAAYELQRIKDFVFDGENGFLLPFDVESFVKKILYLQEMQTGAKFEYAQGGDITVQPGDELTIEVSDLMINGNGDQK